MLRLRRIEWTPPGFGHSPIMIQFPKHFPLKQPGGHSALSWGTYSRFFPALSLHMPVPALCTKGRMKSCIAHCKDNDTDPPDYPYR